MRYFPIFFDLDKRKVLVVGGGEEALRKVRLLLKTNARIQVVAEELHDELVAEPRVEWLAKHFEPSQIEGASLVYAAEPHLNEGVSREARERDIPVNVIDVAELSTFLTPSIVDRDPVVVAIGTEGTAPVLGQGIRARIDSLLPQALGQLAMRASALRERVAAEIPHGNRRRAFWSKFFFGRIRDAAIVDDETSYQRELDSSFADESSIASGRLSIVGAGPGDPELLTLKAQRKLLEADVIVYSVDVPANTVELARRDAERVVVSPMQFDIAAILLREVQVGRHVVYLVNGDAEESCEEQLVLEQHGYAVEIVPGIPSAKDSRLSFISRDDIATEILRRAS